MTPARARRRAALLLYAAAQFVVLTLVAMQTYGGGSFFDPFAPGYGFTRNFLSDLGTTRAWSGQPNHLSAVLFAIALVSLGAAVAAFAGAWRVFAFQRGRARIAGLASHVLGVASGAGFAGVGCTPFDKALDLHNTLVIAAFALLLGYVLCLTIVSWCNDAPSERLFASLLYLVLVAAYVASIVVALRTGVSTPRGWRLMIISQKVIAYGSMLYVLVLTRSVRAQLSS